MARLSSVVLGGLLAACGTDVSRPAPVGVDSAGTMNDGATPSWTVARSSCSPPPTANAMFDTAGELRGLVPVAGGPVPAVAFVRDHEKVRALAPDGSQLWTAETGAGEWTGGFDFDDDGWPDFVVARQESGTEACGEGTRGRSWLALFRGVDGGLAWTSPVVDDICWSFPTATYPTPQWSTGSVLFGVGTPSLVVTESYAETSSFLHWTGDDFDSTTLVFPSSPRYDQTYAAARPNSKTGATSHVPHAHIANGLLVQFAGEERVVFFTSGRVVQYAHAPLGRQQLRADHPFLSGGRRDLAGRNYGLVTVDPADPGRVALLAGTTAFSVHEDRIAGERGFDRWGQIERHVALYDLRTGSLVDRFLSFSHDEDLGHQYVGRLVYPDSPWVRGPPGGPSRLAFSVFDGDRWVLHVTEPGGVEDSVTFEGHVLWDIRDLDGDGRAEWVTSPAPSAEDADPYLPAWRTQLWHWDEGDLSLVPLADHPAGIPALVPAFLQPTRRSSLNGLYPAPVVAGLRCGPALVLRGADGAMRTVTVP